MSCEYMIVPMNEALLDAAAELERRCFSRPWSRAQLAEELTHDYAFYLAATASEGELLGYVGAHLMLDEAEINNVATAPEHRRQGIAKALLCRLIDQLEKRGAKRFFLEVRQSNRSAIALYEQLGFAPLGLRKNYYSDPVEHAVIMGKETEHADTGN